VFGRQINPFCPGPRDLHQVVRCDSHTCSWRCGRQVLDLDSPSHAP
jgi:hypothetical protein